MKFRICDECGFKDTRLPGTDCPMCESGTMEDGEVDQR